MQDPPAATAAPGANTHGRLAAIALVTSSLTSSSALSDRSVSHHSRSTSLEWYRAHGTAPGSEPNSRKSHSCHSVPRPSCLWKAGQALVHPVPRAKHAGRARCRS